MFYSFKRKHSLSGESLYVLKPLIIYSGHKIHPNQVRSLQYQPVDTISTTRSELILHIHNRPNEYLKDVLTVWGLHKADAKINIE